VVAADDDRRFEPIRHVLGAGCAEDAAEVVALVGQRIELWRSIAERIPSTSVRFRLSPTAPFPERVVTADEWAVLALLDGRRTVADLITATEQGALRVGALLYRMLLEELIQPVPTDR
jgi:hypothetical protein